jgi:hypothetical protein
MFAIPATFELPFKSFAPFTNILYLHADVVHIATPLDGNISSSSLFRVPIFHSALSPAPSIVVVS